MNGFIEALLKGNAYGYITNHGLELSKDELIAIIKEYEYALPKECEKEIHSNIAECLEELLDDEN